MGTTTNKKTGDIAQGSIEHPLGFWSKAKARNCTSKLRILGTVAGILAMVMGTTNAIFSIISPICLTLSLWQILIGFMAVTMEAPSFCSFMENVQATVERLERRIPYIKAVLYICAPCPSILRCLGASTLFGSLLVIITGVFYGFRGKKMRVRLVLLTLLASIFLSAPVGLMSYWVGTYGSSLSTAHPKLKQFPAQFNDHPSEMLWGFLSFGFGLLLWCCQTSRTSRGLSVWFLHTICTVVTVVYISRALLTIFGCHATARIPHFYSLHSWFGLGTVALFAVYLLQCVYGFFRALLLLCRREWREAIPTAVAALAPTRVQSACSVLTFVMICITAIVGVTQLAIFSLSSGSESGKEESEGGGYADWVGAPITKRTAEAIILNAAGVCLAVAAITIPICVSLSGRANLK